MAYSDPSPLLSLVGGKSFRGMRWRSSPVSLSNRIAAPGAVTLTHGVPTRSVSLVGETA